MLSMAGKEKKAPTTYFQWLEKKKKKTSYNVL